MRSTLSPTLALPRSTRPVPDRAAPGDREHVLDRAEERLVDVALGRRDVAVDRLHQLEDRSVRRGVLAQAFHRLERRAAHHRDVVAGEVVLLQKLTHLELDQVQKLRIVDHVALVHEHDDVGHVDLAGEQHVLARLRHRAVGRRDHQDRPVHLRRAGDHVLDVVGVARAVDVRVVALLGLVLDVRRRDRDAALALFRRVVDRAVVADRDLRVVLREHHRDRSRQRRLAVVHVADRPHVHVRLVPFELLLRHWTCSPLCEPNPAGGTTTTKRTTGQTPSPTVPHCGIARTNAQPAELWPEPATWRGLGASPEGRC
jgi:hypothetical protein